MSQKVKKRIFNILETSTPGDFSSSCFTIFIMTLILLNIIAVIFETVKTFSVQYARFLEIFEVFSVGIFTIEYLFRLWTCTIDKNLENPFIGRIRFIVTPLALVDLMAILPFYLPLLIPLDLRFVRGLRLFRLFRLFKMTRYSESLKTLGSVLKAKKEELIITLIAVFTLLLFASSLMYFVEHEAQPRVFTSIPAAMWWGVITLTTVGYGEIYPITHLGKFLGAIIAILGVGTFALPAGIIASGFAEVFQKRRGKQI
jgi:voltage-gated potassium channel